MVSQIFLAVGVVGVLALISGLGLSVASTVLEVPTDEKVAKLEEVLPGINCGACGYSGCEGYAKAMADGSGEMGLCSPGGQEVLQQTSEILGKSGGHVHIKNAQVMCGGNNTSANVQLEYNGIKTCKAAMQLYNGQKTCQYSCLGFGDCFDVCQYGAIKIIDGLAVIDEEKCTGCEMCMQACPKNLIRVEPFGTTFAVKCSSMDRGVQVRKACTVGCIGCMRCVKECQYDAIKVENFLAVIDEEKCTSCGKCAKVCPTNCIN